MEKTIKIDLKQREHLVDLLKDARRDEEKQLEAGNNVSHHSIIREYAEKRGYIKMFDEAKSLEDQISDLERKRDILRSRIQEQGFDFSGSTLSLSWRASSALRNAVEDAMEHAKLPIQKSLKKYDTAMAHIWTASSSEELLKSVEGLI